MARSMFTALTLSAAAMAAQAAPSTMDGFLFVDGAAPFSFTEYDGIPAASTGILSEGVLGSLLASSAGTVSFTFLGKDADYRTNFDFNGLTLADETAVGSTISGAVEAGFIPFSFRSISLGETTSNGNTRQLTYISGIDTPAYGRFNFVIGFNDTLANDLVGGSDYDDFVIGVKFTPAVPESSTLALALAGLAGMGVVSRLRRR